MSEKKSCTACAKQISRLDDKPYFGALSRNGLLELIDTLHRYAHNRASAVIDEAKVRLFGDDGSDRVPSSAQLWALCKSDSANFVTSPPITAPAPFRQPNRGCPECHGIGFRITERGDGISGAARCSQDCPIPTGGSDGSSATPFNYARERQRLERKKPGDGSVRMSDIKTAFREARQ